MLATAMNVASRDINPALDESIVLVLLCYVSPPLIRQCADVSCIGPMQGHCLRRWPTFKQHWGGVSVYTLWTHGSQHKVLASVVWILASACDGEPALNPH